MIAILRAGALAALFLAAACSAYLGESRVAKTDFRASLSGAAEVPPTDSRGLGYFEAVYRPSTKVLEYRLNLVGLSGPITMAWLQGPAGATETAERIVPINIPIYDYTIWDGATLTEGQAADLLAGRWYVNVMTLKHPDGEIRGQILPLTK
ncbi:MAG: CHRD domain-containing protein [Alphaproteobacteria bacterium]|nr:CHRD domain-containing protein [Alphaproteobacteria bacterium]